MNLAVERTALGLGNTLGRKTISPRRWMGLIQYKRVKEDSLTDRTESLVIEKLHMNGGREQAMSDLESFLAHNLSKVAKVPFLAWKVFSQLESACFNLLSL